MSYQFLLTFETGSLTGTSDSGTSTSGTTPTLATDGKLKGNNSFLVSVNSSVVIKSLVAADECYLSAFLYITALPSSSNERLLRIYNAGGAITYCHITITSGGKFQLLDGNGAQVGSDSTITAVAGGIYRIGLRYRKGSGANAVLEGHAIARNVSFSTPFASTSSGSDTTQVTSVSAGVVGGAGAGFSGYFDHIEVNDIGFQNDSVLTSINQHFLAQATFCINPIANFVAAASFAALAPGPREYFWPLDL